MKVIFCTNGLVVPWHSVLSFYPRQDGFVWANLNTADSLDVCVGPVFDGDVSILDAVKRNTVDL